jgi:hypothetical protein
MNQITVIIIFVISTLARGKSLENVKQSEVNEELFEGDIVLNESDNIAAKNGLIGGWLRRWRKLSNSVIVPYIIRKNDYCNLTNLIHLMKD